MRPRRTPSSNMVVRLPGGAEDNDLWVRLDSGDGQPTLTSVWELGEEERAAVANGANIELTTWGAGTPPVALRVTTVPLGRA